jgi:hypothetical protein
MENIIKNVATVLGIATFAFGAYYLYAQRPMSELDAAAAEQSMQSMLANTASFITYSRELDQVGLELSVLEDPKFRSLQSVSGPLQEQPVGRTNPFAEAIVSGSNSE